MLQPSTQWPRGDGEMSSRIRDLDWATSSLGDIARWSDRLRVMVELILASPLVSSLVCGPERVLIYNDAAAKLYGDRHPAALGRSLPETFPEGWATVAPFYERAFTGETVQVAGQPLDTRGEGDATDVFDALLTPVHGTDGRVAFVHMMGTEIGARAREEAVLRESEARQSLLIGSWAQAVWETDAEGVVVADSPSWRAYTGLTLEGWLGYGWLDAIHPDERGDAERQWREAIAARGLVNAEFRLRAPDGGWRWTNIRAAPVRNARGEIEKWAGMNIDIEDRKRSEAALRESEDLRRIAVTGGRMGTWRWNLRDGRIWGDDLFMSLWGFPPTDEPRRLPDFTSRMSEQGQAEIGEMVSHAVATGEEFDGQLAVVDGPTKGRWIRWRGLAERQRPWIVNGVTFDVTEQRWAEERLRASEERQAFLLTLGDAMRAQSTPNAIIEIAARLLGECLNASRIMFAEFDEAKGIADIFFGWFADGAKPFPAVMRLEEYEGPILDELRAGRIVRIADTNDPDHARPDLAAIAELGVAALLSVPLIIGGKLLVNLSVHQHTARRWTDDEVALAQEVAERLWADLVRVRAEATLAAAEAWQRVLLEGIPQLVWRAARSGEWTWASPQWSAYTGQSELDSRGWGWIEPLHPDDRPTARAVWGEAAEREGFDVEYRILGQGGGGHRWFRMRATPVRDEAGTIIEWLGTATDVNDLRTIQVRLEVLINELQHRARNLLGVVTAVAGKTLRQGSTVESFEERLQALSRAQALLSQAGSDTVEVGALVRAELTAYAQEGSEQVRIGGPEVQLTARQVQNFALALHELTTNAVKYGALKDDNGWLSVTWEVVRDRRGCRRLALRWTENGVAVRPQAETRRGYGTELIQEALAYALEADVEYELGSDGVRCRIEMPVGQPE